MCSQTRKTAVFLCNGGDVAFGAGQPHYQLVTESKRAVVPPLSGYGVHREVAPLRELLGDQSAHEFRGDIDHTHESEGDLSVTHPISAKGEVGGMMKCP